VEGVACRRLLNLRQERFVVAHHQISDALTFLNGRVKLQTGNARSHQGSLDDRPRKTLADAESRHCSNHAFAANRGGLDPLPIRHHSQKGNHSLMGEIYLLNRFPRLLQKRP